MTWNQWLELLSLAERTESTQSDLLSNRSQRFVGDVIEHGNRELLAIGDLQHGVAVCTSPSDGGEISSLTVYEDGRWHELLYRANDFTKIDGWPGRAPWLWPVAGRCYVAGHSDHECAWRWDGIVRPIERHGFARHQPWSAISPIMTADSVTAAAELYSMTNHQESYPFAYMLITKQQLSDNGLRITFRVEASSENTGAMPFCLGMHFTFNFSSWWGDDWLSGTLQGLGDYAWRTDNRAQPADRFELPLEAIPLGDPAFNSAIIPARADMPVKLVSPNADRSIEMSFDDTAGTKNGDLTWVSYLDAQKEFFSLEPWIGWPNAINSGRGRVELQPGQSWEFRLKMNISAARSATQRKSVVFGTQKSLA